MAIGRTFKEALMKGIRSLETGRKTPISPSDPAELVVAADLDQLGGGHGARGRGQIG